MNVRILRRLAGLVMAFQLMHSNDGQIFESVEGPVSVSENSGLSWVRPAASNSLTTNLVIKTGLNGTTVVSIGNKRLIIKVMPNSIMTFLRDESTKEKGVTRSLVDLRQGKLLAVLTTNSLVQLECRNAFALFHTAGTQLLLTSEGSAQVFKQECQMIYAGVDNCSKTIRLTASQEASLEDENKCPVAVGIRTFEQKRLEEVNRDFARLGRIANP